MYICYGQRKKISHCKKCEGNVLIKLVKSIFVKNVLNLTGHCAQCWDNVHKSIF